MPRAFCLLLLIVPALAHAHPVPKDNHDRSVYVHLTPSSVVVEYRHEVDESRAVLEMRRAVVDGQFVAPKGEVSREEVYLAYCKYLAPLFANHLVASLDGKELTFRCVQFRSQLRDHIRFDYRFVADWKLAPGGSHSFEFREGNYPVDSFSFLSIRLSHSPKLTISNTTTPSDELIARSPEYRKPGDDERLRVLKATVVDSPSFDDASIRLPMPADRDDGRPPPTEELSRYGVSVKPANYGQVGSVKPNAPPIESEDDLPPSTRTRSRMLDLLLDTKSGLTVLLFLAAVFGAAHALTPGHGKTLVAAYLVGQHGTFLHALVLGLVTTLTHTGSVILLAMLLAFSGLATTEGGTNSAMVGLNLVGGLTIAGLGVWLLMKRLGGQADHVHIGGGHGTADLSQPGASWWATVLMGMSGGIVPCWDAIILLLFALSVQRLWLGVVLLLAFSAGLAAVLVALGLLVVAAKAGAKALASEAKFEKVARALTIASAVAIVVIGLVMAFSGVRGA